MKSRRLASTLVVVLVALVISTAVGAQLLRTILLREQNARILLRQRQAQLLAEAGLERALLALKQSPDYTGESWQPRGDDEKLPLAAEIKIENASIVVTARVGEGPRAQQMRLVLLRGETTD